MIGPPVWQLLLGQPLHFPHGQHVLQPTVQIIFLILLFNSNNDVTRSFRL
ncbi:hypothetical protein PH5382_03439 [Phaeobacter sp. CECT 5382]|nr:hypothetical protein PH5382_03439 [Phaeobacter sp. CECT 5382]